MIIINETGVKSVLQYRVSEWAIPEVKTQMEAELNKINPVVFKLSMWILGSVRIPFAFGHLHFTNKDLTIMKDQSNV